MKKGFKMLFASLAVVLGMGAAGVAGMTAVKETEKVEAATNVTIYLDVHNQVEDYYSSSNKFYWDASGAVIKVHYYGGSSESTWPGADMSLVKAGYYSISVPSDTKNLIFTRVSPDDGSVWNRSTWDGATDISMTSNISNNVFVMTKYNCPAGTDSGSWSTTTATDIPTTQGYYLVGNSTFIAGIGKSGTEWQYASGHLMNTLSGDGDKARAYNIALTAGSKFKARSWVGTTETWYNANVSDGTVGLEVDGDSNFSVTTTGRYNLFINSSGEAWACNTQTDKAVAFAKAFNTAIQGVCVYQGGTSVSALTSAWSTQVTNSAELDSEGIGVLTAALHNDPDEDLAAFAQKYDYVYGKYGYTNNWTDFANRHPAQISGSKLLPITASVEANNTIIVVIIAASFVGVAAVGGYFLLRKKRVHH